MAKLSSEEIIKLYKEPYFLSANEIQKKSGYFNTINMINKVLNEARKDGTITLKEDLQNKQMQQARQQAKQEAIQKQKNEKIEQMEQFVVELYLKENTIREIYEIANKQQKMISVAQIGQLLKLAISDGTITQEEFEEVKKRNFKNGIEKRKNTINRGKEGLEL